MFRQQFSEVEDACALAQAIVDTVREPLIILDKDLRAIAASRSFYVKFTTNPDDTQSKTLGVGASRNPALTEHLQGDWLAVSAFDTNRDLICAAAAKVYVRGSKGSYDLVAANF